MVEKVGIGEKGVLYPHKLIRYCPPIYVLCVSSHFWPFTKVNFALPILQKISLIVPEIRPFEVGIVVQRNFTCKIWTLFMAYNKYWIYKGLNTSAWETLPFSRFVLDLLFLFRFLDLFILSSWYLVMFVGLSISQLVDW